MNAAYVSAISAVAGSVVGGLTSGYTTWLTQRSQARAGQVAHDLARREDLGVFHHCGIQNVWRRHRQHRTQDAGDRRSLRHGQPDVRERHAAIGHERGKGHGLDHRDLFRANRTVADLREIMRTGKGVDPLKDFSEAAREELHAFSTP